MTDPYQLHLAATSGGTTHPGSAPWSARVRLPWFRALPASCIEKLVLSVEGQPTPGSALRFTLGGRTLPLYQMQDLADLYWAVGEDLIITTTTGQVPAAGDTVTVELTLRMPEGGSAANGWPQRTVQATALVTSAESRWNLGVCTFSFGAELRQGRSLTSCLQETAALGGYSAVEILGAQAVDGYPSPSNSTLERLATTIRNTGLEPLCYDGFIDAGRQASPDANDAEILSWAKNEMDTAAALGCTYIRLNVPVRRELFEAVSAFAERRGLVVLTELHAQTAHDESVQTLLGLLRELDSPRFGLVVDLSCTMQALPAGFVANVLQDQLPVEAVRLIENGWQAGRSLRHLSDQLAGLGLENAQQAQSLLQRTTRLFRRSETDWLPEVLPFTRVVHGKFFEVQDGSEPAIVYADVFEALARTQYQGHIMSEYEGHLWTESPDTFGQLRKHQQMISSYSHVQPAL
ncbi:sugar phosphate isomerase/epimerase [Paenarthrobacter nicotinovorans]|uniref:TIM barrel protein n=1 Tax=Paenarthrobacter nicotinovorans TaxID=29320 RepID=UPI002786C671|nr:TIM barrel protein [Paenarthrobacter nicotinovorans]MDP9936757.1 sugar phosphate isomerase/epimerase [Paenarthrobacter nicotinovorans]